MAEPTEPGLKGCLLPLVILTVMGAAIYGVYQAQTRGSDAFIVDAGPYLDALVAGDWERAATLDHPDRDVSPAQLAEIWTARQGRLGDLTGWSLLDANPGMDPDGSFVYGRTLLEFADRDAPTPVRFVTRPDGTGAMRVVRGSPTSQVLPEEPAVW